MKTDSINKCQYWNKYEPTLCIYWDDGATTCNYQAIAAAAAQDSANALKVPNHSPACNLLGTSVSCSHYIASSPGEVLARCILPDPRRHVCNRATGKSWVVVGEPTGDVNDSGIELFDWDFDTINGYNEGECDGTGTDTTCSGYAPYHMGFGTLQPSDSPDLDTFESGHYSLDVEFGFRLPTNFTIYNIRAALSRCHWWRTDPGTFAVDAEGKVKLKGNWECSCPKDTSAYSEFTLENGPPCNGCKPECSNYTGVCWQYCIDEKMEDGDPILAEQIHELRYYHRENNWTKEAIQAIFIDEGEIFTWHGSADSGKCATDGSSQSMEEDCEDGGASIHGILSTTVGSDGNIEEYRIPAVKVSMPSFEEFTIETQNVELTQGTEVAGTLENFPTLVRALQLFPLSPIIKTEFNKHTTSNDVDIGFFETPYLAEGISTLIYGKLFYSTVAYAINLSDAEVQAILPVELYYFDDIYILESELGPEAYEVFNIKLEATLKAIATISPEKVIPNSLPDEDRTFLMDVPVLSKDRTYDGSNKNTILVFQKANNIFTFDKVTFTKRVVGGMLFQDDFQIIGDQKLVRKPIPNFEKSFMTNLNNNGSMSFHFEPFIDAGLATDALYTYNDVRHVDPVDDPIYVGSTKYKITIPQYTLETSTVPGSPQEFKVIGSNGYALITLNDLFVNNVIENWEAKKIVATYGNDTIDEEGNLTTEYTECEMQIVRHGGDRKLASGQVLVKPKDMSDFNSLCGDTLVEINDLTYMEKRSFEQPPDIDLGTYEEIDTNGNEVLIEAGEFEGTSEQFTIKNYKFVLTLATVMQDSTGRPFTMSRTKPIGMVKQVACPDVEIYYKWTAVYNLWQNLPICTCCGPRSEKFLASGILISNVPLCGDHFECKGCYPAAVWWPYNMCQGYTGYNQVTNLDNWDVSMIGLFKTKSTDTEGNESYDHGSHDMRMMGPHIRYASSGLYCPPKPCACPMLTYNNYMTEEPYFTGYGRIRAGVNDYQIGIWIDTGSYPIMQFGNEFRSVLRSYRTTDQAPYVRTDTDPKTGRSEPRTDWHLMPAAQMFSSSDITADSDPMWDYFCDPSGPNVINPLGFYLADEFDGMAIDETVDYYNRFRFEDIITVQNELNLGYPKTIGQYVVSTGGAIISPFYNFKAYEAGGSSTFIQWAWQEVWKPLERNIKEGAGYSYSDFIALYLEKGVVGNVKGTYLDNSGSVVGSHRMIQVEYPDYKYDWQNKEFRLVCDENMQSSIRFWAPEEKDKYTGEYLGYPSLQLNNGPKRGINWAGEWLTPNNGDGELAEGQSLEEEYNVTLYETCIGNPSFEGTIKSGWAEQVTLFDTGYDADSIEAAIEDERHVVTINTITGDKINTYFQRGLNVELLLNGLGSAPLRLEHLTQLTKLGELMEVMCGTFDELSIGFTFDSIVRTVGRFSFSYEYGPKLVSPEIPATATTKKVPAVYSYHHMPEVSIYKSDLGSSEGATLLYKSDGMELYDGPKTSLNSFEVRDETIEWGNTWDYIAGGGSGLYVVFRVTPTIAEITALDASITDPGRYTKYPNFVNVLNTQVYEEQLINAQENIKNWERKYYVSHGSSADGPPQGGGDEKTLTAIPNFPHTVWQVDDVDGVKGIRDSAGPAVFINKCRGRFVFDTWEDLTLLDSGSIPEMENLQYKLYNQAAEKATQQSTMKPLMPPGLQELLTKNGVNFAGAGPLVLTNSLISTLGGINQFPIMQAEGHSYIASEPWTEACAGDNGCYGGDTFAWRYTNYDDMSSHTAVESLTQYNMGTYWMLQRRKMNIDLNVGLYVRWYSRSTGNRIYQASEEEFSTLIYPEMDIKPLVGGLGTVVAPTKGNPVRNLFLGGSWGSIQESIYGPDATW